MKPQEKTSGTRISAAERRQKALTLRRGGATFDEIGAHLGVSPQRAHQLVDQELKKIRESVKDEAMTCRTLDLERLDRILMGNWNKAISGNKDAAATVLRVLERRAKIIGYDAPSKIAPTTPDGQDPYDSLSEAEIHRRIAEKLAKYASSRAEGDSETPGTGGGEGNSEAG